MTWSVQCSRLHRAVDAERAFVELFSASQYAFWLDSSLVDPSLSRFSFLGDAGGPHGEVLRYRIAAGAVEALDSSGSTTLITGSIFDVLDARLRERAISHCPELPFDFACGYVGYFGYELKGDCGSPNRHTSPVPDAIWMAATRLVVVDHQEGDTWLLALSAGDPAETRAAADWLADTRERLRSLPADPLSTSADITADLDFDPEQWLVRSRATYLADIELCQQKLRAGESYEICLTNTIELPFTSNPFELYTAQRRLNPAPYAAYLVLADTHVLCSSPERFLKIGRDRVVESKPIKGTAPRHPDPVIDTALREDLATNAKSRAENLMIVDLLRNDLGRVCELGSVSVSKLMAVESYATVHQLVSTIHGRLNSGVSAVDAVRACFPGGSMTGAPKLRTMEIIDTLETRARGIYSGAIGYFGLEGSGDLNIVIRTMVLADGWLSVGAGGAIVLDSDAQEEYDEMLLKARAPMRALGHQIKYGRPLDVAAQP
jgi:para-aminobenzoate synthetase